MELMEHQQRLLEGVKTRLSCCSGVLLAVDPGLGKTAVTLSYLREKGAQRVVVFAPKSVLGVWPLGAKQWDLALPVHVLDGSLAKRERLIRDTQCGVLVTNYESIAKLEAALTAFRPDLIVADECHRLKGWQTVNGKAAARMAKRIGAKRLGLSGTPLPNGPIDAPGLFRFLDPGVFGESIVRFRERFCVVNPYIPQQITGYKNMAEFEERFHSRSIVMQKRQDPDGTWSVYERTTSGWQFAGKLPSLPEKMARVVPVELPRSVRRVYEQLETEMVAELETGESITAPNVLTQLLRLTQISGGYLEGKRLHDAKLASLSDRLSDLLADPKRKVLIFARFRDEIDGIADAVDRLGFSFAVLDGRTSSSDRTRMVADFQGDTDLRVIIGQIQAVAEGVTLHRADTVMYYSLDYSEARHAQSQDRIHRLGQTSSACHYEYLVAAGTVDEDIMQSLRRKRDLAQAILERRNSQAVAAR
ncbi:DEAD/DEAH box helicase [Alicyclobacillus tolerans]|uniref:DEAD/DEAH box helicase n=1 Tax=Alicyclobacillus tolerans TaxID=90970 RepID=UPI003B7B402C